VSPISIFSNLWVGVVIAAESFAAVFAVTFGQISDSLAIPFVMATNGCNWLLIEVPRILSNTGSASFRLPIYSGCGELLYPGYLVPVVLLAAMLHRWDPFALRRPTRPAVLSALGVGWAIIALATVLLTHPYSAPEGDGRIKIDYLDVGQGDSAFITFPN